MIARETVTITVSGAVGGSLSAADGRTGTHGPGTVRLSGDSFELKPDATAIVVLTV